MRNWKKHFKILVAFAGHIVSAMGIFCLVAFGVLGLHEVGELLIAHEVAKEIIWGVHALETLMFWCDFGATVVWTIKSAVAMIAEIIADDEDKDED